ncbi:LytTR family DNA-binding domain-containing protein [Spirosoma flavum]|uniref:LytTR family DNA-binding domain-containing protein n=1 Tax=Spirosoma flavum TaxID=2048557 RepID=A0ABW6ASI2_9BACT
MTAKPEIPLRIPGYRHLQNGLLISRLEGNGNYTIVHLQGDHKPLLVSQTLKRFESILPHFIRISKSMMVNPTVVQQVIREDAKVVYLKLTNGLCLPISRRRIPETLDRLGRL